MPPMARTARGSSDKHVDALDNIDLDDMFADEGDALFDGLDIDLGNMDDIARGDPSNSSESNKPTIRSAMHTTANVYAPLPQPETSQYARTNRPRTTARKIKSTMFFDDNDEDFENGDDLDQQPAATTKKKKTNKQTVPVIAAKRKNAKEKIITMHVQKKAKISTVMPPPRSSVAAAGRFGTLPKRTTLSGGITAVTAIKMKSTKQASLPVQQQQQQASNEHVQQRNIQTMAQMQASHPGLQQSPFCGIRPSNTLFYPFMTNLPAEPSLKHRKIYPVMDKIYMAWTSGMSNNTKITTPPPTSDTEPIFQLMLHDTTTSATGSLEQVQQQPPSSSSETEKRAMHSAVTAARQAVASVERNALTADLLAVCALLQRQYDFLQQNAVNMEAWCKARLKRDEYEAAYKESVSNTVIQQQQPQQQQQTFQSSEQRSSLSSFAKTITTVKVALICAGWKEPMQLLAVLPRGGPTKKRKLVSSNTTTATTITSEAATSPAPIRPTLTQSLPPTPYTEMRPSRRRTSVANMIARSARDLECRHVARLEDQLHGLEKQQGDIQKLLRNDNNNGIIIDSTGVWKWLEKSGHFGKITRADMRWKLDSIMASSVAKYDANAQASETECHTMYTNLAIEGQGSLIDRLQSLLVDEQTVDDDESDDLESLYEECESEGPIEVDLSDWNSEMRVYIHLQSFGLVRPETFPPAMSDTHQNAINGLPVTDGINFSLYNPKDACNVMKTTSDTVSSCPNGARSEQSTLNPQLGKAPKEVVNELSEVINAMIADLSDLNDLNNARIRFLESNVQAHLLRDGDPKKHSKEVNLIAKCQQLLKKSKELKKGKNGKAKASKDEYALPW
jgi:hypothetical protein